MRVWWLFALGACNWAHDLAPTQLVDAPGPDAPARCTTDGPPPFSLRVTQAVIQSCADYTFQGSTAIAACGSLTATTLAAGPLDAPLAPLAITPTVAGAYLTAPRLTPDGELLVHQELLPGRTSTASIYAEDDGWRWRADLPFALGALERVGMPSRGPRRHVMVTRLDRVEEAIEDGTGAWTSTTLPFPALGVVKVNGAIHLSADGLRAVFAASTDDPDPRTIRYAVRASIDTPFAGSYPLAVPVAGDPFLTDDCSRLYFSGLDSIFYAQQ